MLKLNQSIYKILIALLILFILTVYQVADCSNITENSNNLIPIQKQSQTFWEKVWGKKSDNKLYFAMFTIHLNPPSFKNDNWNQQLVGIQYDGYLASTLINSFYNRTYMIGFSRTIYEKKYTNWKIDLGYDPGLVYGYKHGQAPFASLTPIIPVIIPFLSITYKKKFGAELNFVPDPAFSFFLRF